MNQTLKNFLILLFYTTLVCGIWIGSTFILGSYLYAVTLFGGGFVGLFIWNMIYNSRSFKRIGKKTPMTGGRHFKGNIQ